MAGPRRRRGGDRAAALGGVAKGGGHQRKAKGGGGGAARCVGASAKQDVGGNRAEELEEREKDPNVISEISRDQIVK